MNRPFIVSLTLSCWILCPRSKILVSLFLRSVSSSSEDSHKSRYSSRRSRKTRSRSRDRWDNLLCKIFENSYCTPEGVSLYLYPYCYSIFSETVNIHIKTDENQEKVVTIFDVRNLHRIVPSVINRFLEVVLDLEHHHPLTGKLEYIRNQSVDIDPGAGRNLILEDQDQSLENVHDLDSGTDHVQDLVLIGDQNIHQMISPVLTVQRIKNQQRIQSVLMIIQISIKWNTKTMILLILLSHQVSKYFVNIFVLLWFCF